MARETPDRLIPLAASLFAMARFILQVSGWLLALTAIVSASAGAWFIHAGANPPPGEGSLGHVGIVIAGIVLICIAVLLGPVGWILLRKAARPERRAS